MYSFRNVRLTEQSRYFMDFSEEWSSFYDTVTGTNLGDMVFAGHGDDIVYGMGGNDDLYGEWGRDQLYGGTGNDRLFGGDDHDFLSGQDGNDYLDGGTGGDSLDGGTGNDTLLGGQGADYMRGGAGSDNLNGGTEADSLLGNAGADSLTGGSGADSFIFQALAESNLVTGFDTITDFNRSEGDKIQLDNLFGTNMAPQEFNQAANHSGGGQSEVIVSSENGQTYVSADTNGDGVSDLFIRLNGTHALTLSDFLF